MVRLQFPQSIKTVYGANYSQLGYNFDNFGNMTNGMVFPMIGTSTTPVNNRPSSYNNGSATINFTYDNSGNMTAAGATTYQWDGANRLKSVNNGTSGSYGFDGNGKRVKKTEGGASTYYVYSSVIGSAVMEVASAGVQRAYVNGGQGNVIAQRNPDGQFYWLHTDHLGSGRKMTNTSGNLTYRAEFDPYGRLLFEWSATPNQNTKKFTGYERDAGSGLDYAQARMYASEWGRFMSPDPKGLAAVNKQSPKSFNRYSYTSGDPVNKVDPAGTDESYWLAQSNSYWSLFTFGIWYGTSSLLSFGAGNSFGSSGETFDIDYSSILAGIADTLAEEYAQQKKKDPIDEGDLLNLIYRSANMRMLLNSSCSAFLSTPASSARARISEIYESGNLNLKRFPIRLGSIIMGEYGNDTIWLNESFFDSLNSSYKAANSLGETLLESPGRKAAFNELVASLLHETGHATDAFRHYRSTLDYSYWITYYTEPDKLYTTEQIDAQIKSKCF